MRNFIFFLLTLITCTAGATDRPAKVQALMEAQGLLQIWDQQISMSQEQGRRQAEQMLGQMMASLNPTPEFTTRFRDAFDEYMKALETPWTAQEVVDVWSKMYGARFTDEELNELLAYYTSPLGRKDVAATQAAMPEFMDHFAQLSNSVAEEATKTYIVHLQKIAVECQCRTK